MESVSRLRHEEAVRFDAGRLEDLCVEHGEDAAEKVIARALEQIAIKLSALQALFADGQLDEMERLCCSLTRIAGQIGMTSLARVTRDVRSCIRTGNTTALAATMGRLQRIGDNSVHAIWSVEDISV